jgi:hypothetical protein
MYHGALRGLIGSDFEAWVPAVSTLRPGIARIQIRSDEIIYQSGATEAS